MQELLSAAATPKHQHRELRRVPRSTAYYKPAEGVPDEELAVMHLIDEIHVRHRFQRSRRITRDVG